MNYQFQHEARLALQRAKSELETGEDHRLRYAALELRIALEALTYDRAQLYVDELQPSEVGIWQPGKLLKVLIEIEPLVNQSVVVRYKREASAVAPESDWKTLGDDTVIPMATVNKHHNALGSSLHMPTMKQLNSGDAFRAAKVREKCGEVIADLEVALASKLKTNFGDFGKFECLKCGANVRRRLSADRSPVEAVCYGNLREIGCGAKYTLEVVGDGEFEADPHRSLFHCPTPECDHEFSIWTCEVQEGASWKCPKCTSEIKIKYMVVAMKPPEEASN